MARSKWFRRYRGWIALAALIVVAGTAFAAYKSTQEPVAETTYTTESAEEGTLSVTVAGTGNLAVRDLVEATPASAGTIATIEAEEGDVVEAGDTLYTLDADDAKAATEKAYSSYLQSLQGVTQAKNAVYKAEANVDELEALQDEQASKPASATPSQEKVADSDITAAERDVTAAKQGLTSANAQCASAKTAYNQAKEAESDLVVEAPVAGIVWDVSAEAGDSTSGTGGSSSSGGTTAAAATTSSSSAPVTIARDGELAVSLTVNEVDLPALETGQRVDIAFDALPDLALTGKVDEIGKTGTVEQGVVSYDVWISLDVDDEQLKSGMSASVTIVTDVARDVLLVSNSAIKSDDDGPYVQVLDAGSAAPRQVYVTTGLEGSSQTVIESGIATGTLVVTKTTDSSDEEEDSGGGIGGGSMMPPMGGGGR